MRLVYAFVLIAGFNLPDVWFKFAAAVWLASMVAAHHRAILGFLYRRRTVSEEAQALPPIEEECRRLGGQIWDSRQLDRVPKAGARQ